MKIIRENEHLRIVIELVPFFHIGEFTDKKGNGNLLKSVFPVLTADRKMLPLPRFVSMKETGKNSYILCWKTDDITIERHLFFYEKAPALRWYDIFTAQTDKAAFYYSDLAAFSLADEKKMMCIDFFSCSDQSNHRMIRKEALPGKNKGAFFDGETLFFCKEGPMPDCQPIPGEYDFLWTPEEGILRIVGTGFDNLRKGETRRANGVVVGLLRDFGRQRYWLERYPDYPAKEAGIVLSNSWPDLTFGVHEEAIAKEIEEAAKAGVSCVFIDDGWFETFMGEIDRKKFPNGFTKLAARGKELGVELGLWCNPLGMDTRDPHCTLWDGAECHDTMLEKNPWNWMARTKDYSFAEVHPGGERTYAGVDLCNEEYFDHILNKLVKLHQEFGIRHFKFDLYKLDSFNTLLGDAHIHYEAYRRLLDELKKAIPELVISMDVTRKSRPNFDFALDYGRLFLENRGRNIPDHRYYHPYMALGNFWYTAKYAPARQMEVEMMPQAMDYDLEYILSTTVFATPLYWGCIANTPPDRQKQMKDFFEMIRPYREKFAGYLTTTEGDMPVRGSWSAVLSSAPDHSEGFIAVYRNGAEAQEKEFALPFGTKLEKIFGSGEAVLDSGMLRVRQEKEFSSSLYRYF